MVGAGLGGNDLEGEGTKEKKSYPHPQTPHERTRCGESPTDSLPR